MMDCHKKIEKYIKVFNIEQKESETVSGSSAESIKSSSWKEKLKSIPLAGKVLWYIYALLKAPFRILALTNETNAIKNDLRSLAYTINEVKKTTDLIKTDLSFRYEKPEEYIVLNVSGFINKEFLSKKQGFYNLFEDSFRGEDIEERLKKYMCFIEKANKNTANKGFFLDFGCGRGELLKILKNSGINVKGVDINQEYVESLKEEGFDVLHGDGIDYLESLPDNSLFGLSAIHVIEHLVFEKLKELVVLAYRKLIPGGVLIVETPNPKCSVALANFYIDFTHLRPCPYEVVCFLLEWAGFSDIKLILSTPVDRAFRTGNPLGDYMDYALVGFKG